MKIRDKELKRIQVFVKFILSTKGGWENNNKDGTPNTYTLFPHTYRKLQDIMNAEDYNGLSEENRMSIDKQIEMIERDKNEV